jgi:hypothetical protein
MRVLTIFFACALIFAIPLTLTIEVGFRIAGRVFDVAHNLLRFAFHLLHCAFRLSVSVTRPLTHLALRATCCVVDCAFYLVLIHNLSTSVEPVWLVEQFVLAREPGFAHDLCYTTGLLPVISWITNTTRASTSRMWMNPPMV